MLTAMQTVRTVGRPRTFDPEGSNDLEQTAENFHYNNIEITPFYNVHNLKKYFASYRDRHGSLKIISFGE